VDRMASNHVDTFLVYSFGATRRRVVFLSPTGTLGTPFDLPDHGFTALAIGLSRDGDTIYYTQRGPNGDAVWQYKVSTATDSLFVPWEIPHGTGDDLLVLGDGSVVVFYGDTGPTIGYAKRYSAAGALLNTYPISVVFTPLQPGTRLAFAPDDPVSFWIWTHQNPIFGFGKLFNIRASDGVVLNTVNIREFQVGQWLGAFNVNNTQIYGASVSCAFWVLPSIVVPGVPGCPPTNLGPRSVNPGHGCAPSTPGV